MKKIQIIIALVVLLAIVVAFNFNNKKDSKVILNDLPNNKITGQGKYSLDCRSHKYTSMTIGGLLIPESSIEILDGSEKQVLYVEGEKAKYFGADYTVIQDDDYLVMVRSYSPSGLTEVISINKEIGVGFDTNTKSFGLSGGPTSATYLISCLQV